MKTKKIVALIAAMLLLPFSFTGCAEKEKKTQKEMTVQIEKEMEGEKTMITVTIGDQAFTATLEKNETAQAFAALLPMTLNMTELNGNEKYHYLMSGLPNAPEHVGQIEEGDLMLFGSDCVVLFYKRFSTGYSYTRLGKIDDVTGLKDALGRGDVQVSFSLQ